MCVNPDVAEFVGKSRSQFSFVQLNQKVRIHRQHKLAMMVARLHREGELIVFDEAELDRLRNTELFFQSVQNLRGFLDLTIRRGARQCRNGNQEQNQSEANAANIRMETRVKNGPRSQAFATPTEPSHIELDAFLPRNVVTQFRRKPRPAGVSAGNGLPEVVQTLEGFHGRKVLLKSILAVNGLRNSKQPQRLYQICARHASMEFMLLLPRAKDPNFRRFSMKVVSKCLVFVMILSVAALVASAQGGAPTQAQEEKAFVGALVRIDADTHMLTAKGTDDKEWQFTYSDMTQVTGPEKTIQGLAGKTGAQLRISYRVVQGKNLATRIEVSADK